MYLKIHKILHNTPVEGPGLRSTIWLQGCSIKCHGCFNKQAQGTRGGLKIHYKKLAHELAENIKLNNGLTVAGGEPLDQCHSLTEMLRYLISIRPDINIILYSGYEFSEILKSKSKLNCVCLSDILIAGPFVKSLSPDKRKWIGSSNQEIIFMTDRIPELIRKWPSSKTECHVTIDKDSMFFAGSGGLEL